MRDEHLTPDPSSGEREPDGATEVRRSVDLDADIAAVWEAVADPAERAGWLDDPDARARHVRIDEAAPGERLVWTWWHPGDEDDASTVSVVLRPADGGGTRVTVTETLPAAVPPRGLGGLRCSAGRWDGRLLGLELRFVGARVAAGVAVA
jgi:Activator of Hsp90 ATPase homolog 1-like protein